MAFWKWLIMVFPVVMYGCESWTVKKAECRRIDAFELWCWRRLLRVPWTARRSNQSILMENQSWIFIGRTAAEAEIPILWPPDAKNWLIWKDPDTGKDWRQEEKGTTEDEMVGWHHWLNGRESEWTPGVGDGQGGLACCDSWGRKESDTTERLNWTELNHLGLFWSCLVTKLWPTLCDCKLPGSSVHGISQARILEQVAISFFLHGIFQTQGWNPGLLVWRALSLPLSHQGSQSGTTALVLFLLLNTWRH